MTGGRYTVRVTWTNRGCAGNQCSYSASTLLSATTTSYEPQFQSSAS